MKRGEWGCQLALADHLPISAEILLISAKLVHLWYTSRKRTRVVIPQSLGSYGAGGRTRTHDLLITNQLLYQLSYTGDNHPFTVGLPWGAR